MRRRGPSIFKTARPQPPATSRPRTTRPPPPPPRMPRWPRSLGTSKPSRTSSTPSRGMPTSPDPDPRVGEVEGEAPEPSKGRPEVTREAKEATSTRVASREVEAGAEAGRAAEGSEQTPRRRGGRMGTRLTAPSTAGNTTSPVSVTQLVALLWCFKYLYLRRLHGRGPGGQLRQEW